MAPQVVTSIDEVRRAVAAARQRGLTIGLVPTMGALHAGHASLMKLARKSCGFVVVSIFVNPIQFGPNEDFSRYPRQLAKDAEICAVEAVDLVFAPAPETIFPLGFSTFVEVTGLEDVLCGASRPGHFRGVATVVLKLFNIIQPDHAFFGQKDAQQVRIIEKFTADLNLPVRIVVGPIVREPDGLALSSRNQYLDADQRRRALVLWEALRELQQRVRVGERQASTLAAALRARIEATPGARLDYAAIADAASLKPVERLEGRVLIALAVWFGSTRLIDNIVLELNPST